jgi:hypothetical protein
VFCYCDPRSRQPDKQRAEYRTAPHPQDMINREAHKSSVTEHAASLAAAVTPLGLGAALIK